MFLAMDTVFDQCSVAIVNSTGDVITRQTKTGKRQQTQQILPMIDTALEDAGISLSDIQALMFNRGPGAFSGIRINTAVVQALSVAHDIPCVGVSSLQAIAQAAFIQHGVTDVYSALDARMQQVYFGQYRAIDGIMQPVSDDTSSANDSSNDKNNNNESNDQNERLLDYGSQTPHAIAIAGDGAALLGAYDHQTLYDDVHPDALIIAQLGTHQFLVSGGVAAAQALPKYVRNQAWKTLKEQGKA